MAKLTLTQAKVVKAKIKAELTDTSQAKAATTVWPNASPAAASVMMSRELKKDNVQEALQEALAKYDLTADRIAGVIDEALGATKTVIIGKEEDAFADQVADHGIRLKAASMAGKFLGFEQQTPAGNTTLIFNNSQQTKKYIDG